MTGLSHKTIYGEIIFRGIGVFTGTAATVKLKGTREPSGIRFFTGNAPFNLAIENISDSDNRTTIGTKDGKVEVVEHLLACLHVLGITDMDIECPTGEIPLLDGSALPFWKGLTEAGTVDIPGVIGPVKVSRPLFVEADGSVLIALPYDGFRISYFLAYDDPRIGSEQCSLDIDIAGFASELAPARSFIESERVEEYVRRGFVKTTDASQALVVYPDGVRGGFRVEREFAKHKMLDLVGDLYLSGRPVKGHFIGLRSGHGLNRQMIRDLISEDL